MTTNDTTIVPIIFNEHKIDSSCLSLTVYKEKRSKFKKNIDKFNRLEELDYRGNITIDALEKISNTLTILNLSNGCYKKTDRRILQMPKLNILSIDAIHWKKANNFLINSCRNLEELYLNISKTNLKDYTKFNLSNLKELYIGGCLNIPKDKVIPRELFKFPLLEVLSLIDIAIDENELYILPKIDSSTLIEFDAPIDLSNEENLSQLEKMKTLKLLYVEDFSGKNCQILERVKFIEKIIINLDVTESNNEKVKIIKKSYPNIDFTTRAYMRE
jgi:hypothetical protein